MTDALTFDGTQSIAVLIGISEYAGGDFETLPAVWNNVLELSRILKDPNFSGFGQVHVSNRRINTSSEVAELISRAEKATDTVFLYIAGHGARSNKGEFYFPLYGSKQSDLDLTALSYESLRPRIQALRARRKILLVDSCFSGAAIQGAMSTSNHQALLSSGVAASIDINGVFAFASSPSHLPSFSPPGRTFSVFTSAVLDTLKEGISASEAKTINMDEFSEEVVRRIRYDSAANDGQAPTPTVKSQEKGAKIRVFWNRAVTAPEESSQAENVAALQAENAKLKAELDSLRQRHPGSPAGQYLGSGSLALGDIDRPEVPGVQGSRSRNKVASINHSLLFVFFLLVYIYFSVDFILNTRDLATVISGFGFSMPLIFLMPYIAVLYRSEIHVSRFDVSSGQRDNQGDAVYRVLEVLFFHINKIFVMIALFLGTSVILISAALGYLIRF